MDADTWKSLSISFCPQFWHAKRSLTSYFFNPLRHFWKKMTTWWIHTHMYFDTFNQVLDSNCRILIKKQEWIPVGCVPPTRWPYPVVSDGVGIAAYPPPLDADTPLMQTPSWCRPPLDADLPCEQNDWQTGVKAQPSQTSFAGGKRIKGIQSNYIDVLWWKNIFQSCINNINIHAK